MRIVEYLFLGESGATLLGFPDTTQGAGLFVGKDPDNGRSTVTALRQFGFDVTGIRAAEIKRGKEFVQLENGPFDLDPIFAPLAGVLEQIGFQMLWSNPV